MIEMILIPITLIIILIFVMGDLWWARYFPQLFLLPLFALLELDEVKTPSSKIAVTILFAALLYNNTITLDSTSQYYTTQLASFNEQYDTYDTAIADAEATGNTVILHTTVFPGSIYNAIDRIPEGVSYRIEPSIQPDNLQNNASLLDGKLIWYIER